MSSPLTPEQLHAHVNGLMNTQQQVDIGQGNMRALGPILNRLGDKETATNSCFHAVSRVHSFLPQGSKIVRIMTTDFRGNPELGGHHYLHHVPTTEGPYVVDFTHRQFDENAPHPLVEPVEAFNQRKAAQQRTATKVLSDRSANAASAAASNGYTAYNLQMRWQRRHEERYDQK